MRPVIALDLDGVLFAHSYKRPGERHTPLFEPEPLAHFKWILEETHAEIVLSSSWRLVHNWEQLCELFMVNGINPDLLIDKTPTGDEMQPSGLYLSARRGAEIKHWLDHNPRERYVVLDDDDDICPEIPEENFVHVKDGWQTGGMKRHHAERAVQILKGYSQ